MTQATPQPQNSKEDFCLSNEQRGNEDYDWFLKEDVKEFIKRLKEEFNKPVYHIEPTSGHHLIRDVNLIKRIDKLAGEKLI